MPMRWTPENDQLLLLKILETHDLSVDTKKVAEAWPGTDANNRPTPRAITERLVKMRQIVKTSNSGTEGHFNIGKGGPSSATSTPRKPRKNAATASKAPTPTSGKRKQDAKATEDTEVAVEEGAETPMRVASAAGAVLKEEPKEDVFMGHDASPSKRVRRASVLHPGMVSNFGEEDSQTELDSSVSEYLPEDSYKMVEDEDFWFA